MTIETRTHKGESYTYEGLYNLSGPDMVKLYNALCPTNPTKRFGDKKAGVTRIWAALGGEGASEEAPKPEKKAEAPKPPKPPAEPKAAKARRKRERRFVYPPKDEIKLPKSGKSYRATLLRMMSRPGGATFAQLMAATWGRRIGEDMTEEVADKTTYEGIRLCHVYVGYGLRQHDGKPTDQCPDGTTAGAIYLIGHGNRIVPQITFDKD